MKIILIGGGGNLKSIVSSKHDNKNIVFTGYTDTKNNGEILGLNYLGNENNLNLNKKNVVITVCYIKSPKDRKLRTQIIEKLIIKGAVFPNLISSCCSINSKIDKSRGNIFINSTFINTGVSIGDFNFFNSQVLIEHDVEIGNNNIFSPGVIVGGESKIGNDNFFGLGVTISDGIEICDNVVIGMGSTVTKSISKPGVYFGVPARIKKKLS
jgi:sugar O-acyltransferase (sialic acid O-acetyltransferase NeuD family)